MKRTLTLMAATALAGLAMTATPAEAATTYTLEGIFSGTLNNNTFSNQHLTFVGVSNGAITNRILGYTDHLSSLTAFDGVTTFNFGAGMNFTTVLGVFNSFGDSSGALFGFSSLGLFNPVAAPASKASFSYKSGHVFAGQNFTGSIKSGSKLTFDVGQTAVSAVPEPATWALMLAGFGMVGFGMRRRSSVKTTVSYA